MKTLTNRFKKSVRKLDTKHPAIIMDERPSTTVNYPAADEDIIRKTAYEFYLARGCQNGFDLDDWVKAEQLYKK